MAAEARATPVIELHFEDRDGKVRVVLPDSHVMAMSVETAVHACGAFKNQIIFKDQFDMLLKVLGEWLDDHKAKIKEAHLTVRDSGLLFLVVAKCAEFDSDLEDELTNLDIEIANDNDYDLIDLNVLAIPPANDEAVTSFISKKLAIRYRLDGE